MRSHRRYHNNLHRHHRRFTPVPPEIYTGTTGDLHRNHQRYHRRCTRRYHRPSTPAIPPSTLIRYEFGVTKSEPANEESESGYVTVNAVEEPEYVAVTYADRGYGRAISLAAASKGYKIRAMGGTVYTWCHDFAGGSDLAAGTLISETVFKVFPRVDVVIFTEVIPAKEHMNALTVYMGEVAMASPGRSPRVVSVSSLLPAEYVRGAVLPLATMFLGVVNINAVVVPRHEFGVANAGLGAIWYFAFENGSKFMTGEVVSVMTREEVM